jgi:hypothetical protein
MSLSSLDEHGVVQTSLGPLLRRVLRLTILCSLGLLDLGCTTQGSVKRKAYNGLVHGYEARHVQIHVKYS